MDEALIGSSPGEDDDSAAATATTVAYSKAQDPRRDPGHHDQEIWRGHEKRRRRGAHIRIWRSGGAKVRPVNTTRSRQMHRR